MMRIALLGSGGQLGHEWNVFLKQNNTVAYKAYSSAELDITNGEAVKTELEQFAPDTVVNAAAYTKVDQAEDEPEKALEVNAAAVDGLAHLCSRHGWKLIHYSTDYVFPGRMEDRQQYPAGYPEDAPAEPINAYGSSKREGERRLIASGADYLLLRVSWLCGAFGNNFIKTMLRLGAERDKLQLVNDQWGSPTFAAHVVQTSFQLLKSGQQGIFHVTSEGQLSWYDLAKELFEQTGMEVEIEPVDSDTFPSKARRPHFSKLSTQKLKSLAGYEPLDWKEGLRALLEEL